MKNLILFFSLLIGFRLFAVQPFEWNWRVSGNHVIISVHIKPGNFLYAKETTIDPGKLKPVRCPAEKEHLTGNPEWVYERKKEKSPYPFTISWQGCSEKGTCYLPETVSFEITGKRSGMIYGEKKKQFSSGIQILRSCDGYQRKADFLDFLSGTENDSIFHFAGKGFLLVMLLTLLGGIALNLTPCVLPMIPINLAIIGADPSDGTKRSTAAVRGTVYGLGIALAYGVLGIAAALGGKAFGTISAVWWFNAVAALIFIVLGLSMFDVILIDLSRFRNRFTKPGNGHLIGVFLMGILAALLAGACVAPVVLAVLFYAADQQHWYGILLPFVLGIGMGLPWPILGAGLSAMPHPGKWMKYVKYGFGLIIIFTGLYYGLQSIRLFRAVGKRSFSVSIAQLNEAIRNSAKPDAKPVLIDFRADWCKNCLAMERTTLRDPEVQAALKDFDFQVFDATDMNSKEVKETLERFKVSGLPAYRIVRGK